ncbi:Leucyl-tRNA synthetase [Trachipleistophora hominis]|uniref:leucine--tRNA ligase n=1 Tax=Trachipleistophora hominis TaxID=72359 RepID=L7JTA8_TRAHO|nr:Leucyl-tRNA synthetase [Trachipleistophora hominis]
MDRKSTTKLQTLEAIEKIFKNTVEHGGEKRPKYFVTFPYPYMNGKLHLGHLYSFSKSEFMARYKCLKGFDAFFPFAFHGTGMPISAAAKKLCEGDQGTVQLLNSIGIKNTEPFKDARHWLYYFPPLAKDVITKFQSYVNWNHSFITTDLNPYYDSFVKWQFHRLKNYISYGKKETIYCTATNQPCLDHDRRTGEGVIPIQVKLRMVTMGDAYFCTRVKKGSHNKNEDQAVHTNSCTRVREGSHNKNEDQAVHANSCTRVKEGSHNKNENNTAHTNHAKTIVVGKTTRFIRAKINDHECIVDHWALENMRHQEFKIEVKEEVKIDKIAGHENYKFVYLDGDQPPVINFCDADDPSITYYEPEKEVLGRTGSKCVVALVNQWFLDYDNADWKRRVAECIEDMNCLPETKRMLLDALGWIDKWGFSRTFGLGTSFREYVIDSLSDSTIYMAFYLAKPELFSDLYGAERKIEPECLNYAAWDYIFRFSDVNPYSDEKELVLRRARCAFSRYYPVDLRVSGKDLIKNHLLFYIFHHVAIFPKDCWPRRIYTNGHLLLNSAKMSKSEGNFLTAEESIQMFGASVTRIVLADAGDFNEDANFSQALADTYVLKLHTFINYVESFIQEMIQGEENAECVDKYDEKGVGRYEEKGVGKYEEKGVGKYEEKGVGKYEEKGVGKYDEKCVGRYDEKGVDKYEDKIENARAAIEKKIVEFIGRYDEYKSSPCSRTDLSFADELLKDGTDYLVSRCDQAYEGMMYRDVVKYGFHEFKTLIELCVSLGCSKEAVLYAIKNNLLVMHPVITAVCDYLLEKYFNKTLSWPELSVKKGNVYLGLEWFKRFSKNFASKAAKTQKKNARIFVGTAVPEWKVQVRNVDPDDITALREFFTRFKVNPKKGMSFVKDSVVYDFDEHRLLSGLKSSLEKRMGVVIEIVTGVEGKGEPYEPVIEFY